MAATFKIKLPNDSTPWGNVTFSQFASSIWGSGNKGDNLWGWPNGKDLNISKPKYVNDDWFIFVTVNHKIQPKKNEQLAFIARYVEKGKAGKGVFCSQRLKSI